MHALKHTITAGFNRYMFLKNLSHQAASLLLSIAFADPENFDAIIDKAMLDSGEWSKPADATGAIHGTPADHPAYQLPA
jgi:hypothetical protein